MVASVVSAEAVLRARHRLQVAEIVGSAFGERDAMVKLHWVPIRTSGSPSIAHLCKVVRRVLTGIVLSFILP